MVKLGRVQCAILDTLPATVEEIEAKLSPSVNQVIYSGLMSLLLRQWIDIDAASQWVTIKDNDKVRDLKSWRLPEPLPPARKYHATPSSFQKRLIISLATRISKTLDPAGGYYAVNIMRGARTPRRCGDLWAIGIVETHRRLVYMERSGWIARLDDGRLIELTDKGHQLADHWAGRGAVKSRRTR